MRVWSGEKVILKRPLEILHAQSGLTWVPKGASLPCWANEAAKADMFLTVSLKDDSLSFEPAWPPPRQANADALPNFSAQMSNTSCTYEDFLQATRPIFDLTKQRGCNFYVR